LANPSAVADIPDGIVLKRDRDLEGRHHEVWVRRTLLLLLLAIPVLALLNVFGQRPATARVTAPEATLKIYAPKHLRGGLLYMARFHIVARQEIKKATLVLGTGWLEGMTVNTIEPSPVSEASANGKLSLELGHIPQGQSFLLFMEFQVNPTNVGRRTQTVELEDGDTKLLSIRRKVTIFP
jgi:hypothetical protein